MGQASLSLQPGMLTTYRRMQNILQQISKLDGDILVQVAHGPRLGNRTAYFFSGMSKAAIAPLM